jgi:hypothetical protein
VTSLDRSKILLSTLLTLLMKLYSQTEIFGILGQHQFLSATQGCAATDAVRSVRRTEVAVAASEAAPVAMVMGSISLRRVYIPRSDCQGRRH